MSAIEALKTKGFVFAPVYNVLIENFPYFDEYYDMVGELTEVQIINEISKKIRNSPLKIGDGIHLSNVKDPNKGLFIITSQGIIPSEKQPSNYESLPYHRDLTIPRNFNPFYFGDLFKKSNKIWLSVKNRSLLTSLRFDEGIRINNVINKNNMKTIYAPFKQDDMVFYLIPISLRNEHNQDTVMKMFRYLLSTRKFPVETYLEYYDLEDCLGFQNGIDYGPYFFVNVGKMIEDKGIVVSVDSGSSSTSNDPFL